MTRVYGIVDEQVCLAVGLDSARVFAAVLAAGIGTVQYRAKDQSDRDTLTRLRELVGLRSSIAPGALIFANDRPDLAVLAGADGVHVGQTDAPVELVRQHFPQLRVGVSTHDRAQLVEALRARPDYVALGPVFATQSKANPEPSLGLDVLAELAKLAEGNGTPSVAIGGISRTTLGAVLRHVTQAALISALLVEAKAAAEPYAAIRGTCEALLKL